MSSAPPFPLLDVYSNELINALWTAYTFADGLFKTNPTTDNWRARKRAYTMFRVAFVDEA